VFLCPRLAGTEVPGPVEGDFHAFAHRRLPCSRGRARLLGSGGGRGHVRGRARPVEGGPGILVAGPGPHPGATAPDSGRMLWACPRAAFGGEAAARRAWDLTGRSWRAGRDGVPSMKGHLYAFSMTAGARVGACFGSLAGGDRRRDSHDLRALCATQSPRIGMACLVRHPTLHGHVDLPLARKSKVAGGQARSGRRGASVQNCSSAIRGTAAQRVFSGNRPRPGA
jgi:hypothetical protein